MLKTARTLFAMAVLALSACDAKAGDYLDIGTAYFKSGGALDFAGGVTCTDATSELNCTGGEVGLSSADIDGGSIDGATIGANSAAAGTFTNVTASGTVDFTGATVSDGGTVTTVDIDGGTIDGAAIGANSAAAATVTTFTSTGLDDNCAAECAEFNDATIILGNSGDDQVGFGGQSPETLLTLGGNNNSSDVTLLRFIDNDLTASVNQLVGGIEFKSLDSNNSGIGAYIKAVTQESAGTQKLVFGTGVNGAAGERMAILRTGQVGIGEDEPGTKLTVVETSAGALAFAARVQNADDTNGTASGISFNAHGTTGASAYDKAAVAFERTTTLGRGALHVLLDEAADSNEVALGDAVMTFKQGGNVSIYGRGFEVDDNEVISSARHFIFRSYTIATLPACSTAGERIYISDETGGATPAFCDATNWRRVSDLAIAS